VHLWAGFWPPTNVDNYSQRKPRSEVQRCLVSLGVAGMKDGKRTWTYGKYRLVCVCDGQNEDLIITFDGIRSVHLNNYKTRRINCGRVNKQKRAAFAARFGLIYFTFLRWSL